MTNVLRRGTAALSGRLPARVRTWLEKDFGKRLFRFAPVAVMAFAATQLTLFVLVYLGVSAGLAGLSGAVAGAIVSYVLSRWAWERKGRPSLLSETLPFWLVSIGSWVVLATAAHYGGTWAHSLNAAGVERAAIVNGTYFAANCLTFAARFLIFHYAVFASPRSNSPSA
ncbi:MAG: hypothetical protein J2P25_10075 [Nocardiopsaceae bacterium]|nr:hypothetical protein [Nocardiopsaceae bacterium]